MPRRVAEVGAEDFEARVLNNARPVLVDYWAPWCAPCVALMAAVESIAEDRPDVCVLKLNLDEHEKTAIAQGVRALPTFILYREGTEVDRLTGAVHAQQLRELVDALQ